MILSLPAKLAGRVTNSLSEAYKEAREKKDTSFPKKIGLFLWSFTKNMLGISKERAETTKTTSKKVQAEINKTVEKYRKQTGLEKVAKEDSNFYNRILATAMRSFKEADQKTQKHAGSGLEALKNQREDKDDLNFEQKSSLAAVSVITLSHLKKKYPKRTEFKKMLDRLAKVANKSKFPIRRLLNNSLVGVFKLKTETDAMRFVKGLNIQPAKPETAQLLIRLSDNPSSDDIEEITKIFKKKLFKSTPKGKVKKIVKLLKKMTHAVKGSFSSENLTEFVFLVDEKDYKSMVSVFKGA